MMKIKLLVTEHQARRRNRTELNSKALNFTGYPRGVSALSVIRHYLFQLRPTHFHSETIFCGYKKQRVNVAVLSALYACHKHKFSCGYVAKRRVYLYWNMYSCLYLCVLVDLWNVISHSLILSQFKSAFRKVRSKWTKCSCSAHFIKYALGLVYPSMHFASSSDDGEGHETGIQPMWF